MTVHKVSLSTWHNSSCCWCETAGRRAIQAAGSVQQVRYSVLCCIQQLAASNTKLTVWQGLTDQVAQAVMPYLDGTQSAAVKEAAAQVMEYCFCLNKN